MKLFRGIFSQKNNSLKLKFYEEYNKRDWRH